jgi:hypothetical protein
MIDQTLVEFPAIHHMRTHMGLPTRRGQVPTTYWRNAVIRPASGTQQAVWEALDESAVTDNGDGTGTFHLTTDEKISGEMYHRLMRAIYKIGLELVYVDHGPDLAFEPKFDDLRKIILGKARHRTGWLTLMVNSVPRPQVRATYQPEIVHADGSELLFLEVDIFGIRFQTELLARNPNHIAHVPEAEFNKFVFPDALAA